MSTQRAQFEDEEEDQAIVSCSIVHHQGTLTVSVEGNIGSGKTTFLNFCKARPDITVFPEPIDKWRNVRGENLLVICPLYFITS